MFEGFSPLTIDFIWSLRLNNVIADGMLSLIPLYNYLVTLDSDPAPEE